MTEAELKIKLDELLSLPAETEVVEFKEAKNNFDFKELGKYFSALSNEANLKAMPCAWLVFGINNKHQIVGSQYRPNRKDLDHLKFEIAEKISNRLTFIEIYELELPQGRVILFQIPPAIAGNPTAFGGFWFGRDGESVGALNIQELEQIRSQEKIADWSANIVSKAKISDLLPEAIAVARTNYKTKNPKLTSDIDSWDEITFLNKARITIDGKISNAALLLLGKPESQHFIQPAVSQITWILKDKDNTELDYEHFSMPFLLNTDKVLQKIRNLNYRYLPDNTLFPIEVTQYEPYVIREALHNCLAHQDYSMRQRINVIEFPEHLIFENAGSFIPKSVENVIEHDAPQRYYRNKFLCDAMMNLNMIDTIGSGIRKMFIYQKNRFFPLPDYDLTNPDSVKVKLYGKILDKNYTRWLISNTELSLKTVILLDRVQKNKPITDHEAKELRSDDLIEGRKPNYFVTAHIAALTGDKADYIKNRGFKDEHYKKMVLDFINKYGSATKEDIDKLILDILPAILDIQQKENKVRNLVYSMSKRDRTIINHGTNRNPVWKKNI